MCIRISILLLLLSITAASVYKSNSRNRQEESPSGSRLLKAEAGVKQRSSTTNFSSKEEYAQYCTLNLFQLGTKTPSYSNGLTQHEISEYVNDQICAINDPTDDTECDEYKKSFSALPIGLQLKFASIAEFNADKNLFELSLDEDISLVVVGNFCAGIFASMVEEGWIILDGDLAPSSSPTSKGTDDKPLSSPSSSPTVSKPTTNTKPTNNPTPTYSSSPSHKPTLMKSHQPSRKPVPKPPATLRPSNRPTVRESLRPSQTPAYKPINKSVHPTISPTNHDTDKSPITNAPSSKPTITSSKVSLIPSNKPTATQSDNPTSISFAPTSVVESLQPSSSPSLQPSTVPSTTDPVPNSNEPSTSPSSLSPFNPSAAPTHYASLTPTTTSSPSSAPTVMPTVTPSQQPSLEPTITSPPSSTPTISPTIKTTPTNVTFHYSIVLSRKIPASAIISGRLNTVQEDLIDATKYVLENDFPQNKNTISDANSKYSYIRGRRYLDVSLNSFNVTIDTAMDESECIDGISCAIIVSSVDLQAPVDEEEDSKMLVINSLQNSMGPVSDTFLLATGNKDISNVTFIGQGVPLSDTSTEPTFSEFELALMAVGGFCLTLLCICMGKEARDYSKRLKEAELSSISVNEMLDSSSRELPVQSSPIALPNEEKEEVSGQWKINRYPADIPQFIPEVRDEELNDDHREEESNQVDTALLTLPQQIELAIESGDWVTVSKLATSMDSGDLKGGVSEQRKDNMDTNISKLSSMSGITEKFTFITSEDSQTPVKERRRRLSATSVESGTSQVSGRRRLSATSKRSQLSAEDQERAAILDALYDKEDWHSLALAASEFVIDTGDVPHVEQTESTLAMPSSGSEEDKGGNEETLKAQIYRNQIAELIETIDPKEAKNIDAMIEQFEGNEEALLSLLQQFSTGVGSSTDRGFSPLIDNSISGYEEVAFDPPTARLSGTDTTDKYSYDDKLLLVKQLDKAIEQGDWTAVEQKTLLMQEGTNSVDSNPSTIPSLGTSEESGEYASTNVTSSFDRSRSSGGSESSIDTDSNTSSIDRARLDKLDRMIEEGNWDGIIQETNSKEKETSNSSIGGTDEKQKQAEEEQKQEQQLSSEESKMDWALQNSVEYLDKP